MWPQRACTIADLRIGEVVDGPHQEVRLRQEVGVEDGDELAPRHRQPGFERAGLVAGAIDAVHVLDVDALRGIARTASSAISRVSSVESSST
jgi:hypothetical protein